MLVLGSLTEEQGFSDRFLVMFLLSKRSFENVTSSIPFLCVALAVSDSMSYGISKSTGASFSLIIQMRNCNRVIIIRNNLEIFFLIVNRNCNTTLIFLSDTTTSSEVSFPDTRILSMYPFTGMGIGLTFLLTFLCFGLKSE